MEYCLRLAACRQSAGRRCSWEPQSAKLSSRADQPTHVNKRMTIRLFHVSAALSIVLLLNACTPFMVPLREVDTTHDIYVSRTKDEVREAILEGAQKVGWRAKELGEGTILASYQEKNHSIHLKIDYGLDFYSIRYHSSREMKMFCTESDKKAHRNMKVSGKNNCPGDAAPQYIHKAYKQWVNRLIQSIDLEIGPT